MEKSSDKYVSTEGFAPWNRMKVAIVGERRAGKTALCNILMGKAFVETNPTVGLNEFTCIVRTDTNRSYSSWTECTAIMTDDKASFSENNFILSLLDIGAVQGQFPFHDIPYLFLGSYGVSIVVFNMVDVLDRNKKEKCLTELSYWINSTVYHTLDAKTHKMAPVLFAGTHKDKVNGQARHQYISDVIEEKFKYSVVWASIVEYNGLCFFPVNNHHSRPHNYIAQWLGRLAIANGW